jgi:hypothetical protein
MTNEHILFEGFWDSLVTKAKQGAYAAAGALGSGAAKGKLSASLLSDAMFQQWKEWSASTDSPLDAQNFTQFMGKMGFSQDFTSTETAELKKFIAPSVGPANGAAPQANAPGQAPAAEAPKSANDHLDAAAQKARDARASAKPAQQTTRKPFPQSQAQKDAAAKNDTTKANDQKIKDQIAMKNKLQAKKATRESIETVMEDVVQDSELRKFFDQLAKRALKSGEAKSAAQKTVDITPTSSSSNTQQPTQAQPAPAQQAAPEQESPAQAAPVTRKPLPGSSPGEAQTPAPAAATTPQPAAAPAQPAANQQPGTAAPGVDIQFSDRDKELMNAFPAGTNLGSQVTATDPEVQELARKVMQTAFNDYKKRTPAPAPAAKPKAPAKPKPAAATPAAAPEQTPPAAPAA